jgi:hypothetical protein
MRRDFRKKQKSRNAYLFNDGEKQAITMGKSRQIYGSKWKQEDGKYGRVELK